MSYEDVWIGDLDDPHFSWDGANWDIANVPRRLSPFFPPRAPFSKLINAIEHGRFVGKQTDWGGWVAKATKAQIQEFIKEAYAEDETYERRDPVLGHLYDWMQELLAFVNALDDEKLYALVAAEL